MIFDDLTWEDLQEWAGARVVGRGKSYKRNVEDLRINQDGRLVAWVKGGERYATSVRRDASGKLVSECTCPYGSACKHAVAVVLVYLDFLKTRKLPPTLEPDDERLDEIDGTNADFDDIDEKDLPEIEMGNPGKLSKDDQRLKEHLQGLSKTDLVELLMRGGDVIPALRQQLADRAQMQTGNVAKLVASARKEIDRVTGEPAWTNHWDGEGNLPDYSGVKQRLENLLAGGHADAVVELGAHLLKKGIEQIGQSHDEGETGRELGEAMSIVFRALLHSGMPSAKRILWEIDSHLQDDYGILEGVKGPISASSGREKTAWNEVAGLLAERLGSLAKTGSGNQNLFSAKYHRIRVMNWLFYALKEAGRAREIVPILMGEADATDCYDDLVNRLIDLGRMDEAHEWARKGYCATIESAPGIARQMAEQLRKIAEKKKNAPLVAAFRAMEFFDKPSKSLFVELRHASKKAGVWEVVRGHALHFLETGKRPDAVAPARPKKKVSGLAVRGESAETWPLPATGLPVECENSRWTRFPDICTLIEIAIEEDRNDDALNWYRRDSQPSGYGGDHIGNQVADAVSKSHPVEAVEIWKQLAAAQIAHVNPQAYQVAGGYLRKAAKLCAATGQEEPWRAYLAGLRQQNSRRRKMLEVLNALENLRTPIIGS